MLSRKRYTFSDVQDYYYRLATHMVGHSISVLLLAMNEEFSFGKERLSRLIERYMQINHRLNDYQDGDRADAELRTRLAEVGLQEFADHILKTHEIKRYNQECKRMNTVSVTEAAKMQENLQKMKELMNNERYNP